MIERWQVQDDPRMAGTILRYHCWPTIQTQTVGEHTWQIMRIWYSIWGPMPPEVSSHIIFHDAGELQVGDAPFSAKDMSKVFRAEYERLEAEVVQKLGGPDMLASYHDAWRVKVCDILEMWEFGHSEQLMGNQYAAPIIDATIRALDKHLQGSFPTDVDLINTYMTRRKEFNKCK